MGGVELTFPLPYKLPSIKIKAVESSLHQASANFRDLVIEIDNLHSENQHLRSLLDSDKCNKESLKCCSCESLQADIKSKEQKFDSLVSVIRKLCDTKDISALKSIRELTKSNVEILKDNFEEIVDDKQLSPWKGIKDEDVSITEIEGTPIGRKSPIIQTKKGKNQLSLKDKTKCPEDWPTPEKKSIKLAFNTPTRPKPNGRLKQARLSLVKIKTTNTIDLTCSPEYISKTIMEPQRQCNVKKEVFDNDDTILPSPTSGTIKLPVYKSLSKDSPSKMKKLQMAMKLNLEAPNNIKNDTTANDSIHLLQNYSKRFKSPSPKEQIKNCKQNESMPLFHVRKIESKPEINSPSKQPLIENMNIINKPDDAESSLSILSYATKAKITDKIQQTKIETLYKEPAVRKKAEKRALPGWSCDECREFFDELYKDNPEMLARKMDECSKHRGKNNPARPNTPGGFWEPRWHVPDDTEEFNRRNNV